MAEGTRSKTKQAAEEAAARANSASDENNKNKDKQQTTEKNSEQETRMYLPLFHQARYQAKMMWIQYTCILTHMMKSLVLHIQGSVVVVVVFLAMLVAKVASVLAEEAQAQVVLVAQVA